MKWLHHPSEPEPEVIWRSAVVMVQTALTVRAEADLGMANCEICHTLISDQSGLILTQLWLKICTSEK